MFFLFNFKHVPPQSKLPKKMKKNDKKKNNSINNKKYVRNCLLKKPSRNLSIKYVQNSTEWIYSYYITNGVPILNILCIFLYYENYLDTIMVYLQTFITNFIIMKTLDTTKAKCQYFNISIYRQFSNFFLFSFFDYLFCFFQTIFRKICGRT